MSNTESAKEPENSSIGKKLSTALFSIVLTIVAFETTSFLLDKFTSNKPKTESINDVTAQTNNNSAAGAQTAATGTVQGQALLPPAAPGSTIAGNNHGTTDALKQSGTALVTAPNTKPAAGKAIAQKTAVVKEQGTNGGKAAILSETASYYRGYNDSHDKSTDATAGGGQPSQPTDNQINNMINTKPVQPVAEGAKSSTPPTTTAPAAQSSTGATGENNPGKPAGQADQSSKPAGPKDGLVHLNGSLKTSIEQLPLRSSPEQAASVIEPLNAKKTYEIVGRMNHKSTVMLSGAPAEDYWYLVVDPKSKKQGWVFGFFTNMASQ